MAEGNTEPVVVLKDVFDGVDKDGIFSSFDTAVLKEKSLRGNIQTEMTVQQLEALSNPRKTLETDPKFSRRIICDNQVPVVILTDIFDGVDKDGIFSSFDTAVLKEKSLRGNIQTEMPVQQLEALSNPRKTLETGPKFSRTIICYNQVPVVILTDIFEKSTNDKVEKFDNMMDEEPQHDDMDIQELISEQQESVVDKIAPSAVIPGIKLPVVVLTDYCGNMYTKYSPYPVLKSVRPAEPRLANAERKSSCFSELPAEFCQDDYPSLPASLLSKSFQKDVMMSDIADSEDEGVESVEESKHPPADEN